MGSVSCSSSSVPVPTAETAGPPGGRGGNGSGGFGGSGDDAGEDEGEGDDEELLNLEQVCRSSLLKPFEPPAGVVPKESGPP